MSVFLIVLGVILSLVGGGGFVITEEWMNDPDFWWDHAGTSRYTNAINLYSMSKLALGVGIVCLVLGVILYVSKRSSGQKEKRCTEYSGREYEAVKKTDAGDCRDGAEEMDGDETVLYCPNCGKPRNVGDHYCSKCGKKLV